MSFKVSVFLSFGLIDRNALQGLAKGSTIALVGPKDISWVTSQPAGKRNALQHSAEPKGDGAGAPEGTDEASNYDRAGSHDAGVPSFDEEVFVSGWGGDDNDDGMGL